MKDLYMFILHQIMRWMLVVVVFFFMGFSASEKSLKLCGLNEEEWDDSVIINHLNVEVDLTRDANALIKETWEITSTEKDHDFYVMIEKYAEVDPDSFTLVVNGQEYRRIQHKDPYEALSPGEFCIDFGTDEESSIDMEWRFDGSGLMTAVLQYRSPNFVGKWNGVGAAMTYINTTTYKTRIENAAVTISMEDEDLSHDAMYNEAYGFRGEAGFDGPVYRAKSYKPLKTTGPFDRVEIQLLLSADHFESLPTEYTIPQVAYLDLEPYNWDNESVFQKPISLTLGRISRIADKARNVFAAAIVLEFIYNWYWVWRRKKDDTETQRLSEINHRHWKRHLVSTRLFSIALIITNILSFFSLPVDIVWIVTVAPSFLAFVIVMALSQGLRVLSKMDKLE